MEGLRDGPSFDITTKGRRTLDTIPHYRRRLLDPQGNLVDGAKPRLDAARTVEAMRAMLLSHAFDTRATALQRQGRLGIVSPVLGQEATVVGTAMALDPKIDWVIPTYRETPAVLRQGMPLDLLLASLMGKMRAARIPEGVNTVPIQVSLATQLPHAVGLAWGMKLQGREGIVMTYLGEGAASEGDFHESCNLAGVVQAPIVFVLQNNQWAISTSRDIQSAGEYYRRAEGYGFPGVQVDGNDIFAVYEAAEDAVARARAGDGPSLIECVTARLSFHNTTDNPNAYLPEGWLDAAEKEEPIRRLRAYLSAQGIWDEATENAVIGEIAEELDAAVAAAEALPAPDPEEVFEDVFANPTPRLLSQREQLKRELGR